VLKRFRQVRLFFERFGDFKKISKITHLGFLLEWIYPLGFWLGWVVVVNPPLGFLHFLSMPSAEPSLPTLILPIYISRALDLSE